MEAAGKNDTGNNESEEQSSEEVDPRIPTDEEIDARLKELDDAAADYKTSSKEEIEKILTVLGSQVPSDLESYPDPVTDPLQLPKINTISPFREPPETEELPEEIQLGKDALYVPRMNPHAHYHWDASDMFSNPLYFEDVNLERYGYAYPFLLQPFMSVGKFSVQLALLPYQMVNNPIRKCVYPLGYYRPGEWAPKLWYQIPINMKAAAVQAGAITGMIFLIP